MTHYHIRELKDGRVEIAKFAPDDDMPLDTYHLKGTTCTCPSFKIPCKHVKMVAAWRQQSEHWKKYYDDKLQEFVVNPVAEAFGELQDRVKKATKPQQQQRQQQRQRGKGSTPHRSK